ncbi:MAG: putative toxin-antitoxin system toxin component, PIN family [Planctomycetia bacterium]
MRVVFDTGVVVSGLLLPRSVPRLAFQAARDQGEILVSIATLEELDDVLRRSKFDAYITEEQRLEFLAAYIREAEEITVSIMLKVCRDPTDDKFLELAVEGRATHIVSGDPDLLTLSPFRGVAIVNPRQFLSS